MTGKDRRELVYTNESDIIVASALNNTARVETNRHKRNITSVMLAAMLFQSRKINSVLEHRRMACCLRIDNHSYLRGRILIDCNQDIRIPCSAKMLSGEP